MRDAHIDARESVRAHPELKSTFLTVRAAEEFVARRIADPKDRERFLELIRGAMAGSIQKGETATRGAPARAAEGGGTETTGITRATARR